MGPAVISVPSRAGSKLFRTLTRESVGVADRCPAEFHDPQPSALSVSFVHR